MVGHTDDTDPIKFVINFEIEKELSTLLFGFTIFVKVENKFHD
jgi:hypothetical protein